MTEVLSLRPHSKDAEECVIGGLLIDPDTYDAVSEIILDEQCHVIGAP